MTEPKMDTSDLGSRTTGLTGGACETQWTLSATTNSTTCLRVIYDEERINWHHAKNSCKDMEAELVSIETSEEFNQIRNLIDELGS